MTARRVAVVGAGAAGSASAWRLARSGADVTVFADRSGSTSLTSGALDLVAPGEPPAVDAEPEEAIETDVLEFVTALGVWTLEEGRVATRQGVVRKVRGRDLGLLDLETVRGRRVAVADIERDEWDADGLARALTLSAWASRTGTEFQAVSVPALRRGSERRISSYDFAVLHDHPERASWLAGLLKAASAGFDGWLLGSWLGTERSVVERVREAVGLPLGEVTSPPGGPSGARFDLARDRLFEETGVKRLGPVTSVSRDSSFRVRFRDGERERELAFDGVVLAVGGVAAGGIALEGEPASGRRGFKLALEAPARLVLDGDSADQVSSLYGPAFEATGFGPLERVGVELTAEGLVRRDDGSAQEGLTAAGDCVAGRPRTLLEALRSGCAAARTITLRSA